MRWLILILLLMGCSANQLTPDRLVVNTKWEHEDQDPEWNSTTVGFVWLDISGEKQ